jgi:hypothetical protein
MERGVKGANKKVLFSSIFRILIETGRNKDKKKENEIYPSFRLRGFLRHKQGPPLP